MSTYPTFRPAATNAFDRLNNPTTCQCCGRENLKRTVKMTDGSSVMLMGVGCAAKGTGVSARELSKAGKEAQKAHDSAEWKARNIARNAEHARWQAHLDARCPERKGEVLLQIQALGGFKAAEQGFTWNA